MCSGSFISLVIDNLRLSWLNCNKEVTQPLLFVALLFCQRWLFLAQKSCQQFGKLLSPLLVDAMTATFENV